ncbi:hypothetical protein Holit_00917 [Hollandina sp. SP2]
MKPAPPYRLSVSVHQPRFAMFPFLPNLHVHKPVSQPFLQSPRIEALQYPPKRRFFRYPIRQFQKTFEKILLQPPKFLQIFVIFIAPQGRRKGYEDYVYEFLPDISVFRSPRIVYLVQIIREPRQVMDTYVPHLPLPGNYDG